MSDEENNEVTPEEEPAVSFSNPITVDGDLSTDGNATMSSPDPIADVVIGDEPALEDTPEIEPEPDAPAAGSTAEIAKVVESGNSEDVLKQVLQKVITKIEASPKFAGDKHKAIFTSEYLRNLKKLL